MPLDQWMQIEGFMEPEELEWLYDQARNYRSIVEVGCWLGRSTSALAEGCNGRVYTVDTFEGSPSELDAAHAPALERNLHMEADVNLGQYVNVHILKMESLEASRFFRRHSVDMVFIDGEHTLASVLTDLMSWFPKARKLVCGHDRDWSEVMRALAIYGVPFERGPGQIWYIHLI